MKFPLLLLVLFCAFSSYSQDLIETRSGEKIVGKVIEITDTHVRYYLENQPDGPIRNIALTEVSLITYADGFKERFVHTQSGPTQPSKVEDKDRPENIGIERPPGDPLFNTGIYLDLMVGYGTQLHYAWSNMYGPTVRFGSKWYFGKSDKYRVGLQTTWLRFGAFADDIAFMNSLRYGYFGACGLGVTQAIKFNELMGLEIHTGAAPLILDFPPAFDELGLLTSIDVKFRLNRLAIGLDYTMNHARFESSYQVVSTSIGVKF